MAAALETLLQGLGSEEGGPTDSDGSDDPLGLPSLLATLAPHPAAAATGQTRAAHTWNVHPCQTGQEKQLMLEEEEGGSMQEQQQQQQQQQRYSDRHEPTGDRTTDHTAGDSLTALLHIMHSKASKPPLLPHAAPVTRRPLQQLQAHASGLISLPPYGTAAAAAASHAAAPFPLHLVGSGSSGMADQQARHHPLRLGVPQPLPAPIVSPAAAAGAAAAAAAGAESTRDPQLALRVLEVAGRSYCSWALAKLVATRALPAGLDLPTTLAAVHELLASAQYRPGEISEQVVLTALWTIESLDSQLRSRSSTVVRSYLEPLPPGVGGDSEIKANIFWWKNQMAYHQLPLLQRARWRLPCLSASDPALASSLAALRTHTCSGGGSGGARGSAGEGVCCGCRLAALADHVGLLALQRRHTTSSPYHCHAAIDDDIRDASMRDASGAVDGLPPQQQQQQQQQQPGRPPWPLGTLHQVPQDMMSVSEVGAPAAVATAVAASRERSAAAAAVGACRGPPDDHHQAMLRLVSMQQRQQAQQKKVGVRRSRGSGGGSGSGGAARREALALAASALDGRFWAPAAAPPLPRAQRLAQAAHRPTRMCVPGRGRSSSASGGGSGSSSGIGVGRVSGGTDSGGVRKGTGRGGRSTMALAAAAAAAAAEAEAAARGHCGSGTR